MTSCTGRNRVRNQSDRMRRWIKRAELDTYLLLPAGRFYTFGHVHVHAYLGPAASGSFFHSEKRHLTTLWQEKCWDALLDLLIENCFRLRNK